MPATNAALSYTPQATDAPRNRNERRALKRASPVDAAANDVRPLAVSTSHVDDATRARLTLRALSLDARRVPKSLPKCAEQRVLWLMAIQSAAWRDRESIARVAFGGAAVTPDELAEMGRCVSFAREVIAGRRFRAADTARTAPFADVSDGAMLDEMRSIRSRLCDALAPYFRHRDDPTAAIKEKRRAIRRCRVQTGARQASIANARMLSLCAEPAVAAWLPSLPKGEAAAVNRLRELDAEWTLRLTEVSRRPDDLPQRVWVLATEVLSRVLEAGRYLARGDATRTRDYAGFKPIRTRSRKPEAPAPPTP